MGRSWARRAAVVTAAALVAAMFTGCGGGGGGSKSAAFCKAYGEIAGVHGTDAATLEKAASLYRKAASSAPSKIKAALNTLADDEDKVRNGHAGDVDETGAETAASAADAYAEPTCHGGQAAATTATSSTTSSTTTIAETSLPLETTSTSMPTVDTYAGSFFVGLSFEAETGIPKIVPAFATDVVVTRSGSHYVVRSAKAFPVRTGGCLVPAGTQVGEFTVTDAAGYAGTGTWSNFNEDTCAAAGVEINLALGSPPTNNPSVAFVVSTPFITGRFEPCAAEVGTPQAC